jgi:hypothetical protein
MDIKLNYYKRPVLNQFDLLGTKEVGLSKAFAYLMAKEPEVLIYFLHDIGIKRISRKNLSAVTIDIERERKEGRTDIEIALPGKFHAIVECKVGSNKIKEQRDQYIPSFEDGKKGQKVLCFLTQVKDFNKFPTDGITILYRGWLDILEMLDRKEFKKNKLVNDFIRFVIRGFKMKSQKEILIQDLSRPTEIKRFRDHRVYRRDPTLGSPLYFAPYFTKSAEQEEGVGIFYLSRVLGVLTVKSDDVKLYKDDLLEYSSRDKGTVEIWINGSFKNDHDEGERTYYFLAEPVLLNKPLLKGSANTKWLHSQIPKNMCITFEDFTKSMMAAG